MALQPALASESVAAGGPTAMRRVCLFIFFPFSFLSLNETHRLRSHTLLVVRNPIHMAPGAAETCDSVQTVHQDHDDDDNNSSVSNFNCRHGKHKHAHKHKKTNQSRRGSPSWMQSTFFFFFSEDCTEPILRAAARTRAGALNPLD